MNYIKLLSIALLAIFLYSCTDDVLGDPTISPVGNVQYRFMASIGAEDDEEVSTRVSISPDVHDRISLHWENGDIVNLRPNDDPSTSYQFVAKKYICRPDGSLEEYLSTSAEVGSDDKIVYFLEYSGDPIPNATSFSGTATYATAAADPDKDLSQNQLTQIVNDDSSHLHDCEYMSATLENVDLTVAAGEWTTHGVQLPVVFTHSGPYAYLKILTHGFKYTIWGGGTVKVYIMDETPDLVNDKYNPDASIKFGSNPSKTQFSDFTWPNLEDCDKSYPGNRLYPTSSTASERFIAVPEYYELKSSSSTSFTVTDTPEKFDPLSQHYICDDITGTFYVPIKPQDIPANKYIAVVLQCGWSKDLYVWEKKVPFGMKMKSGELYLLDYMEKTPEYAVKLFDNLVYMRSTYLEQDVEGKDGKAPCYTVFGEKVSYENQPSDNPNRMVGRGSPTFTGADVALMRENSGALYNSTTQMASILPVKDFRWKMDQTKADKPFIRVNGNLQLVYGSDTTNYLSPFPAKDYMQKLTKGIIETKSYNSVGAFDMAPGTLKPRRNSFEFVLKNMFDPVMKSPKTSNLWRAAYGRDIHLLTDYTRVAAFGINNDKQILVECLATGHRIILPHLPYFKESGVKGELYDGSDGTTSKWTKEEGEHVTISRSICTFGSNNPAYTQGLMVNCDKQSHKIGLVYKFSLAMPVMVTFKWDADDKEELVPWDSINQSYVSYPRPGADYSKPAESMRLKTPRFR